MYFFDGHSDMFSDAAIKREKMGLTGNILRDHLPRLEKGNIKGWISVLWISLDWADDPKTRFPQLLPLALKEIEECGDKIRVVKRFPDVVKAEKEGVPYIIIGVEGASGFTEGENTIRHLYDKGVRHIGLSWNEKNDFATGVGSSHVSRGLTRQGREAIQVMEELSMLVDVSHLNEKSFWDVMDVSKGIVIASHSNCRALCSAERNLTDQQIKAIASRGGTVGMNTWGDFVKAKKPTVEDFVDHVDHIVSIAGIETVACGFDYCDYFGSDPTSEEKKPMPVIPELHKYEDTPVFQRALEKRGYSQEDIEKIAYKNIRRVLAAVI